MMIAFCTLVQSIAFLVLVQSVLRERTKDLRRDQSLFLGIKIIASAALVRQSAAAVAWRLKQLSNMHWH